MISPRKNLGDLLFIKKDCIIVIETQMMGTLKKIEKKKDMTFIERRGKGGCVTVIYHKSNGFSSLVIEGSCETPKGIADSPFLHKSILSVGYEMQHLFPGLFLQKPNSSIISYTLPATGEDRNTKGGLHYSFHYILNGGSDIKTAISQTLPFIPIIKNKIITCMKEALDESQRSLYRQDEQ